ncbi:hypothetical protein JCM3765_001779, partial [Sporobolomyces pararoseus]
RFEGGFAQRPNLEANAGPTYCAIASYYLCNRLSSLPLKSSLLRWLIHRQISPSPPSPPIHLIRPNSPSSIPSSYDPDDSEEEEEEEDRGLPNFCFKECAGFQGRTNKPLDACYSFWSLGALRLLLENEGEFHSLVDTKSNSNWLLNCQHVLYGGIGREPGSLPDVYHTYLSLAALSLGQPITRTTSQSLPLHSEVSTTTTRTSEEEEEEGNEGKRGLELGLRELDVAWNIEVGVAKRIREKIKVLQERDRDVK